MTSNSDLIAGVSAIAAFLSLGVAALVAEKFQRVRAVMMVIVVAGLAAIAWIFFRPPAPDPSAVIRAAEQSAIEKAAYEEAQRRIVLQRENEEGALRLRLHNEALKKATDEAALNYTKQLLLSNKWVDSQAGWITRFYPDGSADYLTNTHHMARYTFDASHVTLTAAWGFGQSQTFDLVHEDSDIYLTTTFLGTKSTYRPVPLSP